MKIRQYYNDQLKKKENDIKGTLAILNKAINKSYVNCTQIKSLEVGDDVVYVTNLILFSLELVPVLLKKYTVMIYLLYHHS